MLPFEECAFLHSRGSCQEWGQGCFCAAWFIVDCGISASHPLYCPGGAEHIDPGLYGKVLFLSSDDVQNLQVFQVQRGVSRAGTHLHRSFYSELRYSGEQPDRSSSTANEVRGAAPV